MRNLIKTILFCSSIFLNGCYNRGFRTGHAIGKEEGRKIQKAIDDKEKNKVYQDGFRDGEYQSAKNYAQQLNEIIETAKTSIGKSIYVSSEQANVILNAFKEAEIGNSKPMENVVNIIGELSIGIVERKFAEKNYKISDIQKRKFYRLLKEQKYDISAQMSNDFLRRVNKTDLNVSVNEFEPGSTSTENSIRGNWVAQAISASICSFAPMLIASMVGGSVVDMPEPIKILIKRPCEVLLINIADRVGTTVQYAGVVKDFENKQAKIQLIRGSSAILETATLKFVLTETRQLKSRYPPFSSGILQVKYRVSVKAGVNLNKSFHLRRDDINRVLFIRLPKSDLLNISVEPIESIVDDGRIADLRGIDLQNIYVETKNKGWGIASKSDIKTQADSNAKKILSLIFKPILENPFAPYKIKFES